MSVGAEPTGRHSADLFRLRLIGNPCEVCLSYRGCEWRLMGGPRQIVLVRMCTDIGRAPAAQYHYANGLQGLFVVARDEGSAALYRGVGPNVIRSVIMSASSPR